MGYGSSLPANGSSALEHHHQVSLTNAGSSEVDLYHVKLSTFISIKNGRQLFFE